MPLIHERTFHVRHYECDAHGHVNHANYLRYIQQAAMEASAAAGYDVAWYEQMQRQWLIRETDITFWHPLTYGDAVVVKTWVADFRRVRSRRAYELRYATTGERVAEAHTDWVYLDTSRLRPVTIPPAMITAFHPEGLPENGLPREPFPVAPPPPLGVYTVRRRVEWHDLDAAHHVNNAAYMAYIEDCGVRVLAHHGWPMGRIMETGLDIVARRYRIEYKQPALMDEELEIATWISDVEHSTAVRHYTITRVADRILLVRAHVLLAWIDRVTGHPVDMPSDFMADFAANMAEEA
jgi:acyl-CoA thioester hydrolase